MARVLDLVEGTATSLPPGTLTVEQALALSASGRFEVGWPGPQNSHLMTVRPTGWIGHIPIAGDLIARVAPKVTIPRIFEMLEVAYDLRSFRLLDGETNVEALEGLVARLASILSNRVLSRARRGLYGGYREESGEFAAVRGRVNIAETTRGFLRGRTSVQCTFEEHTRDLQDNRILLWTLYQAGRLEGIPAGVRQQVAGAYRALRGLVNLEPCRAEDCVERLYNRLNDDYEPMHGLCRLLLENMGPSIGGGEHMFIPFTLNMPALFELFVARWLEQHVPPALAVQRQHHVTLTGNASLEIRIDIVVRKRMSGTPVAVLDTKYKDAPAPSYDDLYQAAFYANELGVARAFLVYPTRDRQALAVRNGEVTIETLNFDLTRPLEEAGSDFLNGLLVRLTPLIDA